MKPNETAILDRYIVYLESPEFKPALKRLAPLPVWRFVAAFLAFMTTIGIPFTIYQVYRIATHRKRCRRELIEAASRSVPIMTYPLMVNRTLIDTPAPLAAPGLVIGSFDPVANTSVEFMATLGEKLALVGLEDPSSPDEEEAGKLMADEVYVPSRRRRVPAGMTAGRVVHAFDLMILSEYLPGGKAELPMIPCVAEPGESGQIQMIPWWVAVAPET